MGKRLSHQIKSPSVATEGSDFSAKNPTPTQAQHNNLKNSRQARIMPVLSRVFPLFAKLALPIFAILFLSAISVNIFAKNVGAAGYSEPVEYCTVKPSGYGINVNCTGDTGYAYYIDGGYTCKPGDDVKGYVMETSGKNTSINLTTTDLCKSEPTANVTPDKPGNNGSADATTAIPSTSSSDSSSDSTSGGQSTCGVSATGWIICQVVSTIAKWVDGMYSAVKNYLVLPVNLLTSTQSVAASFLPLANIMLAIVFLIIIYSEATGNGFGAMSNYSIKKTLPRLVIFAILVNISFYICAAAVDLSNIIGANLDTFLSSATNCQIMPAASSSTDESVGTGTVTQNLAGVAMKQGDQMKDGSGVPQLCPSSSSSN